jgi:uncharacterized protein with HEPN domain
MTQQDKKITVPFGNDMTPEQRICRMLEIIADLYPLACLTKEEFYREDIREEAGAYAAALGRCASKLPGAFAKKHPEIDWEALEVFRYTDVHDGIDVLILHDRLQEKIPVLRGHLQKIVAAVD